VPGSETGEAPLSPQVTLYWRPGCPYCWRLRTKLKRAGLSVDEINIWEDPAGAAFVRSVTGGDETVPTVRIGTQSLVNPSPRQLLEMLRESSGGRTSE
jgi:mycoredoxin